MIYFDLVRPRPVGRIQAPAPPQGPRPPTGGHRSVESCPGRPHPRHQTNKKDGLGPAAGWPRDWVGFPVGATVPLVVPEGPVNKGIGPQGGCALTVFCSNARSDEGVNRPGSTTRTVVFFGLDELSTTWVRGISRFSVLAPLLGPRGGRVTRPTVTPQPRGNPRRHRDLCLRLLANCESPWGTLSRIGRIAENKNGLANPPKTKGWGTGGPIRSKKGGPWPEGFQAAPIWRFRALGGCYFFTVNGWTIYTRFWGRHPRFFFFGPKGGQWALALSFPGKRGGRGALGSAKAISPAGRRRGRGGSQDRGGGAGPKDRAADTKRLGLGPAADRGPRAGQTRPLGPRIPPWPNREKTREWVPRRGPARRPPGAGRVPASFFPFDGGRRSMRRGLTMSRRGRHKPLRVR